MPENPQDRVEPPYPDTTRGSRGSGARGREQRVAGARKYDGPERRREPRPVGANGLPMWLTVTVVLTLLGLLVWNVIVVGPEGLPTSYILGGLLGAYAGLDQLLRRGGGRGDRDAGE